MMTAVGLRLLVLRLAGVPENDARCGIPERMLRPGTTGPSAASCRASPESAWAKSREAQREAGATCHRLLMPFCAQPCDALAPAASGPSGRGTLINGTRGEPAWFAGTLGISGRTQREWRADVGEWRRCVCVEATV